MSWENYFKVCLTLDFDIITKNTFDIITENQNENYIICYLKIKYLFNFLFFIFILDNSQTLILIKFSQFLSIYYPCIYWDTILLCLKCYILKNQSNFHLKPYYLRTGKNKQPTGRSNQKPVTRMFIVKKSRIRSTKWQIGRVSFVVAIENEMHNRDHENY